MRNHILGSSFPQFFSRFHDIFHCHRSHAPVVRGALPQKAWGAVGIAADDGRRVAPGGGGCMVGGAKHCHERDTEGSSNVHWS